MGAFVEEALTTYDARRQNRFAHLRRFLRVGLYSSVPNPSDILIFIGPRYTLKTKNIFVKKVNIFNTSMK